MEKPYPLRFIFLMLVTMFFAVSMLQAEPAEASSYYYNFTITVTPEYPLVGDEVNVTVHFKTASINYIATFSQLSRDQSTFTLTVDIYVPDIVLWAMGNETKTYSLGKLQEGSYLFKVDVRVWDFETGTLLEWAFYTKAFNIPFKAALIDLVSLARAYGSKPNSPNWNPNVDLNRDNIIGLADLVIFAKHYL